VIPTNRPCIRKDENDSIFKTRREKFNAVVDEVVERHQKGQPVLLGTISVDDSEILSRMLRMRNIPHNVLNAKNHQREAEIVAEAGQKGAVTVATNMAGRGTDIKLGEGVAELGGLHVIGSSRHDARRIDRQLRGRCSRQGDPGSSKFYVSLEDNLMRLFGSDRIVKIFDRFGLEEGEELQHPWLNRSIETAQRRVEQQHFSIRKRTLEYDDVMNKQREIIYKLRKDTLMSDNPHDILFGIIEQVVEEEVIKAGEVDPKQDETQRFRGENVAAYLNSVCPIGFKPEDFTEGLTDGRLTDPEKLTLQIVDRLESAYMQQSEGMDEEQTRYLERHMILDAIDRLWQEHLYAMDGLRANISLRVYAQKDPLVEYKNEAYDIFKVLMDRIYHEVMGNLFRLHIVSYDEMQELLRTMPQDFLQQNFDEFDPSRTISVQDPVLGQGAEAQSEPQEEVPVRMPYHRNEAKVGRNDPCPCGSGKKYKKCCGK